MRTTISINEDWLFTASQIDPALPDLSVMESVNLPHTWNAEDGSDGDDFYHRGVCWYAKKIIRPDGECVFLEVEEGKPDCRGIFEWNMCRASSGRIFIISYRSDRDDASGGKFTSDLG